MSERFDPDLSVVDQAWSEPTGLTVVGGTGTDREGTEDKEKEEAMEIEPEMIVTPDPQRPSRSRPPAIPGVRLPSLVPAATPEPRFFNIPIAKPGTFGRPLPPPFSQSPGRGSAPHTPQDPTRRPSAIQGHDSTSIVSPLPPPVAGGSHSALPATPRPRRTLRNWLMVGVSAITTGVVLAAGMTLVSSHRTDVAPVQAVAPVAEAALPVAEAALPVAEAAPPVPVPEAPLQPAVSVPPKQPTGKPAPRPRPRVATKPDPRPAAMEAKIDARPAAKIAPRPAAKIDAKPEALPGVRSPAPSHARPVVLATGKLVAPATGKPVAPATGKPALAAAREHAALPSTKAKQPTRIAPKAVAQTTKKPATPPAPVAKPGSTADSKLAMQAATQAGKPTTSTASTASSAPKAATATMRPLSKNAGKTSPAKAKAVASTDAKPVPKKKATTTP